MCAFYGFLYVSVCFVIWFICMCVFCGFVSMCIRFVVFCMCVCFVDSYMYLSVFWFSVYAVFRDMCFVVLGILV